MEGSTVSIEQVRALVAERQRFDDWLQALEARRAETPARVYERVHGDYRSRRDGVTEQLREHVDTLSSLGDQLEQRLAALESEIADLEDQRAEAMLRTAVGEFDSERWESVRTDVESRIVDRTEARNGVLAEFDDVRTLLASARAEQVVSAADASAGSDANADANADADVKATAGASADADADAVAGAHATADVTAEAGAEHQAASPVAASDSTAVTNTTQNGAAHELIDVSDFLDEVAVEQIVADAKAPGTPDTPAAQHTNGLVEGQSVWATTDNDSVDDVLPLAGPETAGGASASSAAAGNRSVAASDEGFDDLAFLRSVVDPSSASDAPRGATSATDQQKTLRCTDCGTMNLPTEWYCERCGGELAAF